VPAFAKASAGEARWGVLLMYKSKKALMIAQQGFLNKR
jgi:hypothetical protein